MTPRPWSEPPLNPTPEQAREALRRELVRPEYHDTNLVQRLLDRLERVLGEAIGSASAAPALQVAVAMLVLVGLVVAIAWLLTRARRGATGPQHVGGAVLTGELVAAAGLRRRAEAALAEGRYADAVVDGFRALTLRQVEQGHLEDSPGATAHEVARALEARFPHQGERVEVTAGRFDAVLYGDRPASATQARDVLLLDDDLRGRR